MSLEARTVREFDAPVVDGDGTTYRAAAYGRERDDGKWEGWIRLRSSATGAVLETDRETTQPNLVDLEYWASGLSRVYLEGALRRAVDRA